MGFTIDKNYNPKEVRVIVQNGTRFKSFRLLRDAPVIQRLSRNEYRQIQRRLRSSEKAEPEEIVSLILSLEKNDPSINRCGGPLGFEPIQGKYNFWVTDLVNRDPTAPQLTTIADAWDFCYQIYPRKWKEILELVVKNDSKMSLRARRFQKCLKQKVNKIIQEKKGGDSSGDDTPNDDTPKNDAPPEEKD